MRTVLITGMSGGIGKAIAQILKDSENLYLVWGGDRKYLNVNDEKSIDNRIKKIIKGNIKGIDILINCAGYGLAGALEETTLEQAKANMETNFWGTVRVCKAVIPIMRKQYGGTIINISSSSGIKGHECSSIYCASKFAIEGFSESLWWELKPFGIRVKVIELPGTKTRFARNLDYVGSMPEYKKVMDGMKDYFASPNAHKYLLNPEDVAKVVFEAIEEGSDRFRYQVGTAVRAAKKKWKDPIYIHQPTFWEKVMP